MYFHLILNKEETQSPFHIVYLFTHLETNAKFNVEENQKETSIKK